MSVSQEAGKAPAMGLAMKRTLEKSRHGDAWAEGDLAEVISSVTLRKEETADSDVVIDLLAGTVLEVLEIGAGPRVKVSVGGKNGVQGWVCFGTDREQPVKKVELDLGSGNKRFTKGEPYTIDEAVALHSEEGLESDVVDELQPGTTVDIEETGKHNTRRMKVSVVGSATVGWISACTTHGRYLVSRASDQTDGKGNLRFGTRSLKVKRFLEAARSNNIDELKELAEGSYGAMSRFSFRPSPNCCDVRGKTALIYGAASGHLRVVEYLLTKEMEADVDRADDTSRSALHHACRSTRGPEDAVQERIVAFLLNVGACVNSRDHNGCTPLVFAAASGHAGVVRELLAARADLNLGDFDDHTPLDYARSFGHAEVREMLKDSGGECGGVHEDDDEAPRTSEDDEEEDDEEPLSTTEAPSTTECDDDDDDDDDGGMSGVDDDVGSWTLVVGRRRGHRRGSRREVLASGTRGS